VPAVTSPKWGRPDTTGVTSLHREVPSGQAPKWSVRRGTLWTEDRGSISMSCTHEAAGSGSCGGCFARLYFALRLIEANPGSAATVVKEVFDAMLAEEAVRLLRGGAP
jgi:hypothetical protein